MVLTKKFSEFVDATLTDSTNDLVGLSNGANAKSKKVTEWTTATRPTPPFDGLLGYNTDLKLYEFYDSATLMWIQWTDAAALDAKYILQQPSTFLPNAQSLSALTTGILKSATTTGVLSISAALTSIDGLTTSADKMIYTTASNVYAVTPLTAVARALLADSSASAMRTTLGLGTAAVKNATDNAESTVASAHGSFVVGHVLLAADTFGTVKDGGSPAGMGTVTSISAGTGIAVSPSPITSAGTVSFASIAAYSLWANNTGGSAVPTEVAIGALTNVDDTNVTMTLGGTPTYALINAVSMTLGWAGQLAVPRGGTGNSTFTAYSLICAGTTATGAFQNVSGVGTANQVLTSNGAGALPSWQVAPGGTPEALTKVDDTNVTLTLGGTPSTALLQATSITAGWTGELSVIRGGTGLAAVTAHYLMVGNGTSALALLAPDATPGVPLISQGVSADPVYGTAVVAGGGTGNTTFTAYSVICAGTTATGAFQNVSGVGTSGQVLTSGGAGALPSWTTIPGATSAALTKADDTNVTLTLGGTPSTALLMATSITAGWTGQLSLTRGGTAASLTASNGGIVYSTATELAILAGTATAGQMLQSGSSTAPAWSTSTYPATNAVNTLLYASSANVMAALATANNGVLVTSSGGVPSISSTLPNAVLAAVTAPTVQKFTSGSGTYTTPANCKYIRIVAVAGGGGGGGSGTTDGGSQTAGGATTFGSVISLAGGNAGTAGVNGGAGGTGGVVTTMTASPGGMSVAGGGGSGGIYGTAGLGLVNAKGGHGGASFLGGGSNSTYTSGGTGGVTNSGGGGGGGACVAAVPGGGGAGAGAGCDVLVTSPAATYSYAVGAAGTAGNAGTSGTAGTAGGSGVIVVYEFYV